MTWVQSINLQVGDAVIYGAATTDGDITGLENGNKYYVVLQRSQIDPLVDVNDEDSNETLNLDAGHGFITGDAVIYSNGYGEGVSTAWLTARPIMSFPGIVIIRRLMRFPRQTLHRIPLSWARDTAIPRVMPWCITAAVLTG